MITQKELSSATGFDEGEKFRYESEVLNYFEDCADEGDKKKAACWAS